MEYQYYMPTKVIAGENCIVKNSSVFSSLGTKAILVTGTGSAKKNGSLQDVLEALESVGIESILFDKIMSNPTIDIVYEGAELAKKEKADFVIAIGGGSPMDAGKAIALLASQDIKEEELFSGNYENKVFPMAFVPTTAGTGSEVTPYSILTNDKAQTKTSIASPLLFPKVAFLDARYMMGLGQATTINTAIDALSHAVEGMLSVRATAMSDFYAVESTKILAECLRELRVSSESVISLELRERLLHASMLAGIVISHTGTTAVHSMGYSLTYFKDIDHGRANGLLLPSFLEFIKESKPERVEQILSLMNCEDTRAFRSLLEDLLGKKETITEEEIKTYSSIAIKAKNIANGIVIAKEEDLQKIFRESLN
jgi:alcohol dehydrogenase class IV